MQRRRIWILKEYLKGNFSKLLNSIGKEIEAIAKFFCSDIPPISICHRAFHPFDAHL